MNVKSEPHSAELCKKNLNERESPWEFDGEIENLFMISKQAISANDLASVPLNFVSAYLVLM